MSDSKLEDMAADIVDGFGSFEGREFKGFRTTISDDIRDLLIQSNPSLEYNNTPVLSALLVTSIHSVDPCSSCSENLANMTRWADDHQYFNNELRLILLDSSMGFDEKKIWDKLKVSFDDVPVTYFFNEGFGLIDVVQGVMSTDYLERFWTPFLEKNAS